MEQFKPTIVLCRMTYDNLVYNYLRNSKCNYACLTTDSLGNEIEFETYDSLDQLKLSVPPSDFRKFLELCGENELLSVEERVDFKFALSILNQKEDSS